MDKQDINWEEKRFWASVLILSGLCANYHHNLIPSDYWATASVELAIFSKSFQTSPGALPVQIIIKEMALSCNPLYQGPFPNNVYHT